MIDVIVQPSVDQMDEKVDMHRARAQTWIINIVRPADVLGLLSRLVLQSLVVMGEGGQDGADGPRPSEDWLTSGRVHGRQRAMERGDQDNYW